MARRQRQLSADERALWQQVAATARRIAAAPLCLSGSADAAPSCRNPAPPAGATPAQTAIPASVLDPDALLDTASGANTFRPPTFRVGEAALGRTQLPAAAGAPPRMDSKLHRRMSRGKLAPEARLDLHGLTLNRAEPVLTRFVLQSHASGLRLVLVITGKGRGGQDDPGPLPVRPGALRHHVPIWLRRPPLSRVVLQADPAHRRHGGEGAYYIYLRRHAD